MAAPTRTKAQREADLAEITRRYCSGHRQVDIAAALGIAQQQVSYDLKAIFADWRKTRDADLTHHLNEQLAKIDTLELEYWDAWRRSCEDRKRTVKEQRKGVESQTSRAAITEESMLGNPSYLAGVQWCIAKRVEILGLAAPQKHQHGGDPDNPTPIKTENRVTLYIPANGTEATDGGNDTADDDDPTEG